MGGGVADGSVDGAGCCGIEMGSDWLIVVGDCQPRPPGSAFCVLNCDLGGAVAAWPLWERGAPHLSQKRASGRFW